MSENVEQTNESNGIVEIKYGNEIYKTWTVKLISPLITKFLKGIYPDSLAIRGLTDIVVFDNKSDEIVPTEIQKSQISKIGGKYFFNHSRFEDVIRRQLEDNIETYGKCWFFFDSEYLRYLQFEDIRKNISINMTWLVKLMSEEKLKVFTIKYDGTVKELTTKDFDFLKDVSQTCVMSYDSDQRILNRNKLKIKRNVLRGHNFTQEEINQFESEFDNRKDKKEPQAFNFYMKSKNKRCELYGNVIYSIGELPSINDSLSCNIDKDNRTFCEVTLGLFYQNDFMGNNKNAHIKFIDKFNIAQYFPGYIRNKETWDYCKKKQRIFTMNEFRGIINGTFNYQFIKKQSTMEDF